MARKRLRRKKSKEFLRRSRASRKGWATRRLADTDERSILADLVDATRKFGVIDLQDHERSTHHGSTWDLYTVGIESVLDLSRANKVFAAWKKILHDKYGRAAVLRGRLITTDEGGDSSRHWYTIAAVENHRYAYTQLRDELKHWSSRQGPSGLAEGIDGFEAQLEIAR